MIKIYNLLKSIIFYPKYSFIYPEKKLFLVYDKSNFEFFKKYLIPHSYQIFYTRNEAYNFPILVETLFKYGLKNLKFNYKTEYIKKSKCKYIITMTDNDLDFLKIDIKNIKKIAIQNSYRRDAFPDVFSFLKYEKYKIYNLDYIFCFNEAVGKKYKKYFNCKYIPIGSLRNNLIPKNSNKVKSNNIAFISQFRSSTVNKKKNLIFEYSDFIKFIQKPIFKKNNFINLTYSDFYKTDEYVLNNLLKICIQKKIKLHIIGVMKKNFNEEKQFFSKILKKHNWKYIKRTSSLSSYKNLEKFNLIFGIDSTMLYESLARNKNVGFISARPSCFNNNHAYFGWPLNKKKKGFNWTNEVNYSEILRIFNNLIFKTKNNRNSNKIILFDHKNLIFQKSLINIMKKKI